MILTKVKDWVAALTGHTGPAHEVVVYSREGCGCCDKAMAVLDKAGRKYALNVSIVDVDSDPALAAEHGEQVPVVAIDGKVRFRGQINEVLLERLLNQASPTEG